MSEGNLSCDTVTRLARLRNVMNSRDALFFAGSDLDSEQRQFQQIPKNKILIRAGNLTFDIFV